LGCKKKVKRTQKGGRHDFVSSALGLAGKVGITASITRFRQERKVSGKKQKLLLARDGLDALDSRRDSADL
jgi:hypothetical protein